MALKPLQTDQAPLVETSSGKPTAVFYTWLKSLADAVNGLLALFPGGSTSTTAWTAYTPTVTTTVGTLTAYTATGRSYQIGKVVFVQVQINITTNGTGDSSLNVTLPVTPGSTNYVLPGREIVNDFVVAAQLGPGAGPALVRSYDGSYPGSDGAIVVLTGTYEAA